MKKSEKLFMLINKIDENIISDAKGEPQKPNRITIEKRAFPIRETVAAAACFTVLAVGIFAVMRFRINSVGHVDSNPGTSNEASLTNSLNSQTEPPANDPEKEDKELQNFLTDMLPKARELDNLFTGGIDANGVEYVFIYDDEYKSKASYYPVTEAVTTKPDGIFTVPQSRQGFEELLSEHFSRRAVRSYMNNISSGTATQNQDGTYLITTDQGRLTTFIEINGQLYGKHSYDKERLDFDPSTASIISQTDNTVKFSYTKGGTRHEDGCLVYEGGDKLNFFYWGGFITEYPTEFTAEDEELQDILNALSPGETIQYWFNSTGENRYALHFVFDGLEDDENLPAYYYKLPTGKFDGGKESYPGSYSELQTLLLKYFTQKTADQFMQTADKGTVTSVSDNIYHVKTEKSLISIDDIPHVIELDGEMYYMVTQKSGAASTLRDSAQMISRTDDTINYSCLSLYIDYLPYTGILKYERGGWKMAETAFDPDPETVYEPNKELLSDLGLTYDQMVEKYGKLKTNTYKGVMFENSDLIYGWKSETGKDYYVDNDHTNPGTLPEAGGCNVILGVDSSDLLTGFIRGISFETFCERYGFVLVSESDDPNYPGYTAEFSHPLYPGVRFCADNENFNSVNYTTAWWIFLDVDSTKAKPVV